MIAPQLTGKCCHGGILLNYIQFAFLRCNIHRSKFRKCMVHYFPGSSSSKNNQRYIHNYGCNIAKRTCNASDLSCNPRTPTCLFRKDLPPTNPIGEEREERLLPHGGGRWQFRGLPENLWTSAYRKVPGLPRSHAPRWKRW